MPEIAYIVLLSCEPLVFAGSLETETVSYVTRDTTLLLWPVVAVVVVVMVAVKNLVKMTHLLLLFLLCGHKVHNQILNV